MNKWWWLPILSLLMHGALAEPQVVLVTPRGETVMERVFMDELKRRVGPVRFTLIKPDNHLYSGHTQPPLSAYFCRQLTISVILQ